MVNQDRMLRQLQLHEGCKLAIYKDTLGNDTLGIGYNVAARGLDEFSETVGRELEAIEGKTLITTLEAQAQCRIDLVRSEKALMLHWPAYAELDEIRQRVLVDMAFNMGLKVLEFKQTLAAIQRRDWSGAFRELWNSKWAYQVGDGPGKKVDRADRLGQMLLTGNDYTS